MEIERKFLVKGDLGGSPFQNIQQGYFTEDAPEVRVRMYDGKRGELTVKGTEQGQDGQPAQRAEENIDLDPGSAEALLKLSRGMIQKTRYRRGRWEIDVFEGDLEGLMLAEVELDAVDELLPDLPDGLEVVEEVSHDPRFRNQYLALLAPGQKQQLARDQQAFNESQRPDRHSGTGPKR